MAEDSNGSNKTNRPNLELKILKLLGNKEITQEEAEALYSMIKKEENEPERTEEVEKKQSLDKIIKDKYSNARPYEKKKHSLFFRFAKNAFNLSLYAVFGFELMFWIILPRTQRATYTFKGYDRITLATYLDVLEINHSDNTLLKTILETTSPYYQLRDKVIRKFYNVSDNDY